MAMVKAPSGANYGKGYSPRKSMAMGEGGHGDFGVGGLPSAGRPSHPDAGKSFGVMDEGGRGAGPAVSRGANMHPAQAAPDHGDFGVDHFRRGAKL